MELNIFLAISFTPPGTGKMQCLLEEFTKLDLSREISACIFIKNILGTFFSFNLTKTKAKLISLKIESRVASVGLTFYASNCDLNIDIDVNGYLWDDYRIHISFSVGEPFRDFKWKLVKISLSFYYQSRSSTKVVVSVKSLS